MTDELTIEGKQFISSKRASKLSGYAQDYIGQLARGGHIEAQRIGGLWYIHMDSLMKYKEKSESVVQEPPTRSFENVHSDVLVTFEGRDYVSAARAADITGYHQDYIGQLARAGKILSRQVGNRWYVDRQALEAHKEEKDRLLGAVQTAAVGIPAPQPVTKEPEAPKFEEPIMRYSQDTGPLIPPTQPKDPRIAAFDRIQPPVRVPEREEEVPEEDTDGPGNAIPIRKILRQPVANTEQPRYVDRQIAAPKKAGKTMFYAKISGLMVAAIVATFMGYQALDLLHKAQRGPEAGAVVGGERSIVGVVLAKMAIIGDRIEGWVTRELVYIRKTVD